MADSTLDPKKMLEALKKSGVVNADATLEDLLEASTTIQGGVGTSTTVVYSTEKYFCVTPVQS